MANCLFCQIAAGEIPSQIVHQDEHVIAFKDRSPRAPLHVLVIPRRHVDSLREATDPELVGRVALAAAKVAQDAGFGERGFRVVANTGPEAGQTVPHLHFHVLAGRSLSWPPG